jgi:hypothetical protein
VAERRRAGAGRGPRLTVSRLAVAAAAIAAATLAATAQPASGSRFIRVGIYDEAQTLYGPVDQTFALMRQLRVQQVRLNLYWGGRFGVARRRPANATNPNDRAYNWTLYDRAVDRAKRNGIRLVFSIYGTPGWANGRKGQNVVPTYAFDLRNFAYAAARRYSGKFKGRDGRIIPAVKEWLAWNEPNNPIFLRPQYQRTSRGWRVKSAIDYAKICTAIYDGVHKTRMTSERVGCGVTAPRGNNNPNSRRPSVSPLAFLRAVKAAGLRRFDAWAHHPYYNNPSEQPASRPVTPKGAPPTAVTLGNIGDLIRELTRLYGNKRLWITEFGYQTNPPDRLFGVSYARQAAYLREAFAIARRNPRIDMMLWFLLKDEPTLGGWQSGLVSLSGRRKPAFNAFRTLRR